MLITVRAYIRVKEASHSRGLLVLLTASCRESFDNHVHILFSRLLQSTPGLKISNILKFHIFCFTCFIGMQSFKVS